MFFPKKCTLYGLFLPGLEYVNIIQKKNFPSFSGWGGWMLRGGRKTLQKEEGEGSVQRGGKEKVVLKRSSGISRRRWHRKEEGGGMSPGNKTNSKTTVS